MLIAQSARIPIGFEEIAGSTTPFDGGLSRIPMSERTELIGLTVGDALDALVSADPRYRWSEQHGVILIRPVQAWADPDHFLDQPVGGFHVNHSSASDVMRTIYERLGVQIAYAEGGLLGNTPSGQRDIERPLTFDVPSGTVTDALNSLVRAHQGAGWMVHYARGPAAIKTSCVRLVTFDGEFSGVGAATCQATAVGDVK
jgi:hypothetical protein